MTDQGYPRAKNDSAVLAISIQRDIELPTFDQASYAAIVSESAAVGTSVARVQARQKVPVVSPMFSITLCGLF